MNVKDCDMVLRGLYRKEADLDLFGAARGGRRGDKVSVRAEMMPH